MSRDTRELGERPQSEEARKTCACGQPMNRKATACRTCWWEARRRREGEEQRAFVLVVRELRAKGWSQDAVAAFIGMDTLALRVKLSRLRAKGFDIPDWRARPGQ